MISSASLIALPPPQITTATSLDEILRRAGLGSIGARDPRTAGKTQARLRMARIEFDTMEGIVVTSYEVVGEVIYWNAVIREKGHLVGRSVGGNTRVADGKDVNRILEDAVRSVLAKSTPPH